MNKFLVVLVAVIGVAAAQRFVTLDGRYSQGITDGRYVHNPNDGKYVHVDNPYLHVAGDNGQYKHVDNPYQHVAGDNGQYRPDRVQPVQVITPVAVPQYQPKVKYDNQGGFRIIQKVEDVKENGYHFLYETENKILAEENGQVRNAGQQNEGNAAAGFYEYIGDDGLKYHVDYTADENGFIPSAAHIPTPPPIPEAIQRSLAWQAANPQQ